MVVVNILAIHRKAWFSVLLTIISVKEAHKFPEFHSCHLEIHKKINWYATDADKNIYIYIYSGKIRETTGPMEPRRYQPSLKSIDILHIRKKDMTPPIENIHHFCNHFVFLSFDFHKVLQGVDVCQKHTQKINQDSSNPKSYKINNNFIWCWIMYIFLVLKCCQKMWINNLVPPLVTTLNSKFQIKFLSVFLGLASENVSNNGWFSKKLKDFFPRENLLESMMLSTK